MPIVIFHGDNQLILSNKLDEMRKSYPAEGVERHSLKNETFDQLLIKLASSSFFVEQRLLIVEEADEKKIAVEKIHVDSTTTVVFLFNKELPSGSAILKWAEDNKYRVLGLSQPQDKRIFTFLDLLAEKNVKCLAMLEDLIADFGGVYILTMILFLLRRLVLPVGSAPSFIATKLEKQKKNFSQKALVSLYEKTLLTDFQIKTGKSDDKTGVLLLVNSFLK